MAGERPRWPGFWRRLGAYVIDVIVLGVAGVVAGSVVFDQLAALGSSARLIGLVAAVAYFGILSSGVGGSRTLGQRILKLKVLRLDGRPVGLLASCARALMLETSFILNGWAIATNDPVAAWAFDLLAMVAVFGLGLAQLYLLLFGGPAGV